MSLIATRQAEAGGTFATAFLLRLPVIKAALTNVVPDIPRDGRHWVFYGSQPLGADQVGSDLDALLLHSGSGFAPHRRCTDLDGVPVTLYVVTHDQFALDGKQRHFGGYFALKLFSPFATDLPGRDAALAATVGRFLAPFSSEAAGTVTGRGGTGKWTASQLLAHAYLAFLCMYPDAASYLARLRQDNQLLQRVWQHQLAIHIAALRDAGFIRLAGDGLWCYTERATLADAARERSRSVARFWAFGAVCHGSDPGFPDLYFRKADERATRQEQESALAFLGQMAVTGRSA